MDGLRWILLILGVILVAGVYFLDRFKRRTSPRGINKTFDSDDTSGMNMTPHPADDNDYRDALAGLNHMLNENRQSSASTAVIDEELAMAWQDDDATEETAEQDNESTAATGQESEERLIIFYLKAPAGQAFAGPGLFEALQTAGLSLGEMGIFHDADSQGHIIFSVANLFEPGTLDIEDKENFSTRGVALFMQLPLAQGADLSDEQDAFERMLGKAEILAERLGGALHDEYHQLLDSEGVARARSKLITA